MYKFFINENQKKENTIQIIGEDVNHIKNVLRLKEGDKIQIGVKETQINYLCKILELSKEIIETEIIDEMKRNVESSVYLHILQGIPKFEKMEMVIEKCTEIGVSEITPIFMKRTIVKLEEKAKEKKLVRWKKIAEVAAKQSKRDIIPKINSPFLIKNVFSILQNYDIVLVAYENEMENTLKQELHKLKLENKKNNLKIAVFIGPEGGIDDTEINFLKKQNVKVISLGKRILRTETAPIVVSANILYELENEK